MLIECGRVCVGAELVDCQRAVIGESCVDMYKRFGRDPLHTSVRDM